MPRAPESGYKRRPRKRTPAPKPVVRSEAAAGGGYGLAKAKSFKKTAPYRGAVRAGYKTQPVKQRSTYVRKGPASPEKTAILHTHRQEVARNKILREGEARFTGMGERDRRRAEKFTREDALSKATQDRVYANALAMVRRHGRYLPGTNPELNAATAMGITKAPKLARGGLGSEPTRPADTEAKEKAMTTIAVRAAQAGASMPEITKALTKMEKRHKSPALSVLEQTTRPISGVVGGLKGLAKEGPVGLVTGTAKGLASNKESFTKVLKDAGYSKGMAVGAGLVLDIALDPTTYLTLGAGRPALVAARSAAHVAAREAVEKGLERAAVERAAQQAAERTFAAHGAKGVGIKVGLRGSPVRLASMIKHGSFKDSTREVSTSGKLTSRLVGTPTGKLAATVSKRLPQKLRDDLDQTGQALFHSYRPRGFSPVQWDQMRGAASRYRAGMSHAERQGEARMQAYRAELKAAKVPEERHAAIIDAIEVDGIGSLPTAERPIVEAMVRDAESMFGAEVKAGARKPHERVGGRQVEVPASPDVRLSRKELQKTRRAAATAEREVRKAEAEVARYGGRAEVLSRTVAGAKGERAARSALRTEAMPAGGGVGLRQAQQRLASAETKRADALETLAAHTEGHAGNVALAREARAARRRADKIQSEAVGYVARYTKPELQGAEHLRVYRTEPGGMKVQSTSLRARKNRGTLADLPEEKRAQFVEDIPHIMGERTAESGRLRTLSDFNAKLAAHGHPLTPDDTLDLAVDPLTKLPDPVDMQRFYVVGERGDMTPVWRTVDSTDQLADRIHSLVASGKEVVEVPRTTMEAMWGLAKRGRIASGGKGHDLPTLAWDEATRKWKWLVTQPNPGYHARNLIGDTWNARLGGATAADMAGALRTITRSRRHLDGLSKNMLRGIAEDYTPEQLRRMGRTERYGSKRYSDAEVLLLAEQHGAIRAGQIANELRQLRRGTELQERGKAARTLQNFSESREDLMRLATFRRALKRGQSPEEAAAWANKHHFDYSDLTDFEVRALRRVMPFYTWMARNTPRQLASLVTTPGRFASLEKTRDAASEAAGLPEDWALTMPEYVQAQVPFAIPRGLPGSTSGGLPVLASGGLPVMDLNNVTPHQITQRLASAVSPFFKLPTELFAKYDFFYRDKIRKDLVPAPDWVKDPNNQRMLRGAVGALPGVGKPTFDYITDRRTGKRVIAWPWWMDKLARQTPLSGLATGLMTEGRERRPGDKLMSLTNWATGVRRQAISPSEARTTQLFDDLQKIEAEIEMAKQRRDKAPGSPYGGKLKALSKERGRIQDELNLATSDFAAPYFAAPKRKKKPAKFGETRRGSGPRFGSGNFGGSSTKFGSGNFGG